ncbi:MAG: SOS response-associated peptidase family protein [Erysipelotrichaceae bacterium]
MCGRYLFRENDDDQEAASWLQEVSLSEDETVVSRIALDEVRPSNLALVLVKENDRLVPKVMRWGLPKWDEKGILINTRSETALTSPMFKKHIKERRCVIKAAGFYEWDKEKNKLLITTGHQKMYLAALYTDEERASYSILTRSAEGDFAHVHDRSPLLIPEDLVDRYLLDGDKYLDAFRKIPLPVFEMEAKRMQTSLF